MRNDLFASPSRDGNSRNGPKMIDKDHDNEPKLCYPEDDETTKLKLNF